MLIGEILARNARMYGNEVALIEREPAKDRRIEITWKEFDEQANRFANALIAKGIRKGDKVIHLMMNCIEWLPAYFGILRTGAWAVPLNFRFSARDIKLCAGIAEGKVMIFGEEFIERVTEIKEKLFTIKDYIFVGPDEVRPDYAERYEDVLEKSSPVNPDVEIGIEDDAGLYFTSGTTWHHGHTKANTFNPQKP
jgi:acyl-CoA synthetase (AMP-forming)/AMP-acid ligase II